MSIGYYVILNYHSDCSCTTSVTQTLFAYSFNYISAKLFKHSQRIH